MTEILTRIGLHFGGLHLTGFGCPFPCGLAVHQILNSRFPA